VQTSRRLNPRNQPRPGAISEGATAKIESQKIIACPKNRKQEKGATLRKSKGQYCFREISIRRGKLDITTRWGGENKALTEGFVLVGVESQGKRKIVTAGGQWTEGMVYIRLSNRHRVTARKEGGREPQRGKKSRRQPIS